MNEPEDFLKKTARWLGTVSMSCKQAARMQSAALDRKLTPLETFGLRSHLIICKWCARYGKQISLLHDSAHKHAHDIQETPVAGLSTEARERIKRRLQSEQK